MGASSLCILNLFFSKDSAFSDDFACVLQCLCV